MAGFSFSFLGQRPSCFLAIIFSPHKQLKIRKWLLSGKKTSERARENKQP
jgi:hypothetical protein